MNRLLNDHGRKAVIGVADLVIVEDKRQRSSQARAKRDDVDGCAGRPAGG
jgi:hypothetical protein